MSYQLSYSFDERVCGPVTLFEPVDPSMYKTAPHKRAARSSRNFDFENQLEREYDWDDSYMF